MSTPSSSAALAVARVDGIPVHAARFSLGLNAYIIGGVVCSLNQPQSTLVDVVREVAVKLRYVKGTADFRGVPYCLLYDLALVWLPLDDTLSVADFVIQAQTLLQLLERQPLPVTSSRVRFPHASQHSYFSQCFR